MEYQSKTVEKANKLVHLIYKITKNFPSEERFGVTSQIRRASLSIVLNCIEGFARQSSNEFRRFLEIAFGSLKETKYLIEFCYEEKLLSKQDYELSYNLSDEIAKMIWASIRTLKNKKS